MSSICFRSSGRPDKLAIERLAVEQLHREIELAFVLVEAVDGADVRMIQRRRGARFAAEALDRFIARGVARRQNLERDLAARASVSWARYTTPIPPAPSWSRIL